MSTTPAILLILDGFGYREDSQDNAISLAKTPNLDALKANYAHTLINASEHYVGLPDGQMGNSEVGHLNIGAGRVVFQDFERVNNSIETGEFFALPALKEAINTLKSTGKALHILGLLSDGGVHSHQSHIHALLEMATKQGLDKVYVHAFLDGRDTPPISAKPYLEALQQKLDDLGNGKIASICGRFYAMDRDNRWDRIAPAYTMMTEGKASFTAENALDALEAAYARDENDEFVQCTTIHHEGEAAISMEDGDSVVFMNFRGDRARQITDAFLNTEFDGFARQKQPNFATFFTLTQHDQKQTKATPIFPPFEINNTFGEHLQTLGLTQLRIAETEKYPHVTFFFNGGDEAVFDGEDRILVPSPDVKTYDLQPEMSAPEVTDKLVEAIKSQKYNAVICNFANCDMVGHTGVLDAAIQAVETLDTCIGRVVEAAQSVGGEVVITADHGNAELMQDYANNQPHTQHTTNLVPMMYIGRKAQLADDGALSDLAPTLLGIMGVKPPAEMTGKNLISFTA